MKRTVSYSLSVLEVLTLLICYRLDPYVTLLIHNSPYFLDSLHIPDSTHHLLREISNETHCESCSLPETFDYVSWCAEELRYAMA